MNKKQPSCIYLREILLENTNCNLGIEYEFYATVPPGQRRKGKTAIRIKKENYTYLGNVQLPSQPRAHRLP